MKNGPNGLLTTESRFAGSINICNRVLMIIIGLGLIYIGFLVYAGFYATNTLDITFNICTEVLAILAYLWILIYRRFVSIKSLYYSYNSVRIQQQS